MDAAQRVEEDETADVLQNHYPERLHRFYALNVPMIFSAFWRAISPFIDPVTREKIVFLPTAPEAARAKLEESFDLAQLEEALGGDRLCVGARRLLCKGWRLS